MGRLIRFDGQAAIVTGAGGGMGRAYALELAARGAAVLVNDFGGSIFGNRAGEEARAEAVVAEIRAAGGRAVASAEPVGTAETAERIVALALESFGRVDILVNNAGIALPGPIAETAFDRVEALYRTNLIGPHALARAVWPAMRDQGKGRILNITSNAALGIGGNAPYAASKAGLIGLTLDLALEGAPHGILVNAVMPSAYSRMIEHVPDPEFVAWMRDHFQPEKVAAAMLPFLARESTATGMVLSAGGGRLARLGFVENDGIFDPEITAESARDGLAEATDLTRHEQLCGQGDEMAMFARRLAFGRAGGPGLASDALT